MTTMTFDGCFAHITGAQPGTGDDLRAKGYIVASDSGSEIFVNLWPPSARQPKDPMDLRRALGLPILTLGAEAKAEQKDLHFDQGKITGYVRSDGLSIAQLWQVKARLVRKDPQPVFPIIQPVKCAFEYEAPPKPAGGLKRAVVWSDPQFGFRRDLTTGELMPLHDNRALDVILQIAIAAKADRVDVLGDIFDLSDMSAHFLQQPWVA